MKSTILAALFMTATATTSVLAQTAPTPEQMEMAYNAGRNQLGVLKYCQEKGFIDGAAAETQAKLMALIPVPADTAKGDAAEAVGKTGKVSAMGVEQDIATAAKAQGATEDKLCTTMSDMIKQAAAALPK